MVTIVTLGTLGDVAPLVALGSRLRAEGVRVCVGTHGEFERLVSDRGLEFSLIRGNPRELLESEEGLALLESGAGEIALMRKFLRLAQGMTHTLVADIELAARGTNALVFGLLAVAGFQVAESLGIPGIFVSTVPLEKAGELAPPRSPFWPAYQMLARRHCPTLYAFSPALVPPSSEWGSWIHMTGHWFLDHGTGWSPPPGMEEFLGAGPPPVVVGFGSMTDRDPEGLTRLTLEALDRAGRRGVLLSGWAGLDPVHHPENVFVTKFAPHEWLLPRAGAVVHHGGAGTTGTSLRHRTPTIVVPYFFDQQFWGERVQALGAGPAPIPRRLLTAERLASAIHETVESAEMRERASALGDRLAQEHGVERATEVLRTYLPAS